MKNIILRIFTIFIASAIFIGCSKEKLTLSKSSETTSSAKMFPVYNYGGMSGTLVPAPYYAALKFYNDDEKFATSCFADQGGHFKIGTLIPGIYHVMIIYIPYTQGNVPDREYKYFEIRDIMVEPGIVTELDDIILNPK